MMYAENIFNSSKKKYGICLQLCCETSTYFVLEAVDAYMTGSNTSPTTKGIYKCLQKLFEKLFLFD